MKNIKRKVLLTLASLGILGELVHVLQPIGFNILTLFNSFGGYANWVQFIAGASGIIALLYAWKKLGKK